MLLFSLKFKAIVMLCALLLLSFVYMAVQEKELEAVAITGTVLIAIVLLLAACGLVFTEYVSPNIVAMDWWENAEEATKQLFQSGIDEETRALTVHQDVFDYTRNFITDNFAIGSTFHSLPGMRVMLGWGNSYLYSPMFGSSPTVAEFENATRYSSITWGDYTMSYSGSGMYAELYINGAHYSTFANDGAKFTDIKFYSEQLGQTLYFDYDMCKRIMTEPGSVTTFAFFYNIAESKVYPVVIWNYYYGGART